MKEINEYISYIESTEAPLSAEVYKIKGENNNYIFDVGANKESRELLSGIDNKVVIISHFHQDHIGNMRFIKDSINKIYVGDYTYKILGYGERIDSVYEINDGINLKIIHLPNSHAKGSLALIINNEYLLIGDALYTNRYGYNVSLLHDEIDILKKYDYDKVIVSHKNKIYSKKQIIHELEYYYSKREKNKPYISFSVFED